MANDFTKDTSCKALWNFDTQLTLTTDSISTNTLTANGSPAVDSEDKQQGAGSVSIASATSDYFSIADASLATGFPTKSGDSVLKITMCCWVKPAIGSDDAAYYIMGKGNYGVFAFKIYGLNHYLQIEWGVTGIQLCSLPNGSWYHIGGTFDGVNNTYSVTVWDGSEKNTYQGTPSPGTFDLTSPFQIGHAQYNAINFDGKIDEAVVFNRLLSDAEIDAIRNGVFPLINYSRHDEASLPADAADLTDIYSAADRTAVGTDDTSYVSQTASGTDYAIHEFKEDATGKKSVTASCIFRTSLDPATVPIILQVYKVNGATWETRQTYSGPLGVDTDITITDSALTGLSDYIDGNNIIAFRVYQRAS